ncbi:hypothetical protein TrVFT333_009899 [Trichoderma virens FT-333]|nr:hypothetical protein TrVFT333_009899 [Trichoderma virens FT-333]
MGWMVQFERAPLGARQLMHGQLAATALLQLLLQHPLQGLDACLERYYLNLNTNTPPSKMIAASSEPCNFGRGAYDTTGLPKPPPPQPQ